MLIDTGSVVSLFPARHNFPQSLLTPANIAISDVQGKPIHTTGQFTVDISIRPLRRKFSCNFLVANFEQAILGSDFPAKHDLSVNVRQQTLFDNSTGLNSIVKNCSNVHCEIIAKVTQNFPFGEKFQELTSAPNFTEVTHKTEHFIDTGDQRPIAYKARKLSPSKLECAKKEFDMLLQMGIIRRSDSPWAFPLHMVKKSNGEWRPCGDYRALNQITIDDKFPVPNLQMFTNQLEGCTVFSKVDLVKAYHQIPMAPKDIPKTAIITPFGLFEYLRLPFGLKNAGSTFQRFIDSVTQNLPGVYAFVDDILIASATKAEHNKHISSLFEHLTQFGIKISPQKCEFYEEQITFMGHNVSASGVKPSEEKLKTLLQLPSPKDFKELRRILGMFGFYQRFIPNYAKIVAPIRELREDNYIWTDLHEHAFTELKTSLSNVTYLSFPSAKAERYTLTTDASNSAIGGCLHQIIDGKSFPVDFYSRKLSSAEQNYSAFDRELLAIVAAIKKWKHYISGMEVVVFTDHKPIVGAFNSTTERQSDRQQRHFSLISEFITDVVYIRGTDNVVADTLSRVNAISNTPFDLSVIAKNQSPDLQNQFSQPLKSFTLSNDVQILCDTSTGFPRPVVPEVCRFQIFQDLHNLSHPGTKITTKLIKDRFVWPRMEHDIKQWAQSCESCQRSKVHRHTKSKLKEFLEPTDRFQIVHMDIVGPLPTTSDGHSYILTLIDRSTRWIEACPLRSIVADEVAKAFVSSWVSRFGVPLYLITDRGRQFESELK